MEPEPVLFPPPSEPMQVAERLLAERYRGSDGSHVRHWQGEFWHWRTSHWLELADPALRSECYRYTADAVYERIARDGSATLEPWAPNRYKIGDLVDALRAITHLSETTEMPSWLGHDDHLPAAELVACANGLLHVPTRTLLAHDPAFFNRVAVPFDYRPDAQPPTRWLSFLDELWPDDPEAIEVLAEFMGYVISGRRDLHKILLLIGPTRAGKGVIARVLKALVGRGNHAGPTLASLGTNFGLSPLIGKPLAIVSAAVADQREAILDYFASDPIGWRAAVMATQVRPGHALPLLIARPGIRFPLGTCCSCGDGLTTPDRYRCTPCAEAVTLVLDRTNWSAGTA